MDEVPRESSSVPTVAASTEGAGFDFRQTVLVTMEPARTVPEKIAMVLAWSLCLPVWSSL